MILLSFVLAAGCSNVFGENPQERANEALARSNEAIDEHDSRFKEARATYTEARRAIESGRDPGSQEAEISTARQTLQEARSSLEDAREPLTVVQGIEDVDPAVEEYAGKLSEAIDHQLTAEARELEFYRLLEDDPALEENREQAQDLLSEADGAYEAAEEDYQQARELADANPGAIGPSTTPDPAATTTEDTERTGS